MSPSLTRESYNFRMSLRARALSILSPPPADERDAEIEQKRAFFKRLLEKKRTLSYRLNHE